MTKNTPANNLYMFTLLVSKMNETKVNFITLRRIMSPFFKTSTINNKMYSFTLKGTKFSILIIPIVSLSKNETPCYSVVSSKHQHKFLFTVHAETSKELLQKIIFKFNLFS